MAIKNLEFQLPNFKELIDLNPLTVSPETHAFDVIRSMNQSKHYGLNSDPTQKQKFSSSSYALVIDKSHLMGIVTERDIVKLSANAIDLRAITVEEVMTRNIVTLKKSDFCDIYQVISILRQHQIRHLPIINDFGELAGIISAESIDLALNPTHLLKLRSVADIVNTDVLTISSSTSVIELSQLMAKHHSSCVVIVEIESDLAIAASEKNSQPVKPLGIITERDIVKFQILGLDLANTIAREVMSSPLVCLQPTNSLLQVQQEMRKLQVRRMVVTGESGMLEGMINLQDMLEIFNPAELYGVIDSLKQELKQERDKLAVSEKKLRENQQLLELFVRHAPLAIAMVDCEMKYLAISDRWSDDYQLQVSNVIGKSHQEVFPKFPEGWQQDFEDCLTGKIQSIEKEEDSFIYPNGQVNWLRWEIRPWYDPEGAIGGLLLFSEPIAETKLLEQKLKSSETQMRAIFEAMTDLVFSINLIDNSIHILPTKFADKENALIYSDIIEKIQFDLFESTEAEYYRSLNEQILQTRQTFEFEQSLKLEDSLIWFSFSLSAISETEVIWVGRNISHLKQMEQNLLAEKEMAQVTLDSIGDAVIATDASGKVKYLNPVAERLTGWLTSEVRGKKPEEFFTIVNQSTRETVTNPVNLALRENKIYQLAPNTILIAKDGTEYAIEDSAAPIRDRQGNVIGAVLVFHDVTQARRMARELSWQATHDPLTGLYNRRKFEQQVGSAIEDASKEHTHHVLCYLDLDRFKIVNDTCGHAAGDKLLQQITELLQQRIRSSDIFARLGGDEFGLVLYGCSLATARKIAEQLRQLVGDFRFVWSDKTFNIGVSIGLVEINAATENLTSILNQADVACYAAKNNGRNCVYVYHKKDDTVVKRHEEKDWVDRINRALKENRFCLFAQKIVDIASPNCSVDRANCCHYEILLRLIDEGRGNNETDALISPGAFLPAAERYDLMPAIDRWVITTFLAGYEVYCQVRQEQNLSQPTNLYTINLSGASINNRDFGIFLQEQFDRYNVPAETICFEITETVAINNLNNALILIEQLKNLGCSIALDDFGSGMCSFAYLKNLPVDYLKIDGSFVKNIASDRVNYATVECFNNISQVLNIKTIAEFVEDDLILQNLKQIGIDYAQGYGIERPQPLIFG